MSDGAILVTLYAALAILVAALITAWPNQHASGATIEPVEHNDFDCVRLREVQPSQKLFLLCSQGVTYRSA